MPAPLPVKVSRSGWSLWQWPAKKYSHVSRLFIDRHDADARNLIRHFAALKALSLILRAAGYYKE